MENRGPSAASETSPPGFLDKGNKERRSDKYAQHRKNSCVWILIILGTVVVVLALALGLGLGLGLKKSSSSPINSSTIEGGNASAESYASEYVPPWRSNTKDYQLDFTDWDLDAPPTTRSYNFTLGETELAPDGRYWMHFF